MDSVKLFNIYDNTYKNEIKHQNYENNISF
jgi:hypothetical protein